MGTAGTDLGGVSATVEASFASPFRCLTAWSPSAEAPFYCIEPRTALPDAFSNAADDQLVVLGSGAKFAGAMTLDLVEMGR